MLTTPLRVREKEGIPEVVDAMHAYCLARDDLDFVLDVTKFKTAKEWGADPYKDVPAVVKSAFTRAFNASGGRAKCGAMLPDATRVKGRRGADTAVLEEVDAVPGEGVVAAAQEVSRPEEEDEEDEDAVAKAEKMQRTLAKRGVQVQLRSQAGGSKKGKGRGGGGRSGSGKQTGRGRGSAKSTK